MMLSSSKCFADINQPTYLCWDIHWIKVNGNSTIKLINNNMTQINNTIDCSWKNTSGSI